MENLWKTSAPSNIALIKYMGKIEGQKNQTMNPTLSYTLNHLSTEVQLSLSQDGNDYFEALPNSNIKLTPSQEQRFLDFLGQIKKSYNFEKGFIVKSGNNFPSDCGLASSASSFAALTTVSLKAICELQEKNLPTKSQMAQISRLGSGSSCRSFFSPWAFWSEETISEIGFPYESLHHMVFVVDQSLKKVSSSEAHKRVVSSSLFQGRPERAHKRLSQLVAAFQTKNWKSAYEICWAEFWDMHALFETSVPSFGYMMPESLEILNWIRDYWKMIDDGPLVTMDAGPNIHFLFRPDQLQMRDQFYSKWASKYKVIRS